MSIDNRAMQRFRVKEARDWFVTVKAGGANRETILELLDRELLDLVEPLVELRLPYPPSANNLYQRRRNPITKKYDLSKAVKKFRDATWTTVIAANGGYMATPISVCVRAELEWSLPKNHTGDIDNPQKALFDALQNSRVLVNDKLIQRETVKFLKSDTTDGYCIVRLYPLTTNN